MNDPHSGTLRTDYETDRARRDSFPAMESDWHRLLHRLIKVSSGTTYRDDDGREGTLAPLLANHVLTVLADILRKRLADYGESFADAQGTIGERAFSKKLRADIEGWIARLEASINGCWKRVRNGDPTVEIAVLIRDNLKKSLPDGCETAKHDYYRMLRTVKSIQEHADYYLEQITASGEVDGALSLLIAYLKNYCHIAESFNNRLADLPAFYRNELLHVKPGAIVQDNTYILIHPIEKLTLKAGQQFAAGQNAQGEDLIYQTTQDESVSPMQCVEADAVYLVKNEVGMTVDIRRCAIHPENSTTPVSLFDEKEGEALAFGWQIESAIFVLNEGERKVNISFSIQQDTANSLPPDGQEIKGFTCYLSSENGWAAQNGECLAEGDKLHFNFTIEQGGMQPTACNEELHGTSTTYPMVRILSNERDCPYDWASRIEIGKVEIRTHVKGMHNFTFCNELGEVDVTQPFQPFGVQAEHGARFLFGSEETKLKQLTRVHLRGVWQKMPGTKKELDDIYKGYGVDTTSFKISTEWQEKEQWHTCKGEPQPLFLFDGEGKCCPADVCFDFTEIETRPATGNYEYSRDKGKSFRVTLQSPSIGFGTDEYRRRFTDTMIHNSRCKKKQRKELPHEPIMPMLADVELEYEAVEILSAVPKPAFILTTNHAKTHFKSQLADGENGSLYFAFARAKGEQNLRMYLDMAVPKEKIPFGMPKLADRVGLTWAYWRDNAWIEVPAKSVISEETCGLTQSGFIEIKLPDKMGNDCIDCDGKAWLRASAKGDMDNCLAIRNVWMNCIRLTAQNGDGQRLPAGTIQQMTEADRRIERIVQPLPGFGGKPAETEDCLSLHLTARIGNRHRAVNSKDYEQIALEHFPEVDKAVCITLPEKGKAEVCLVVFSRLEDEQYYLSPPWKLTEIERTMRHYASSFVRLKVMNPEYQEITVVCKAVLREKVQDKGKVMRNLTVLAQNYLAPWINKHEIPHLQQSFSYKELHSRMANHEDLQTVAVLTVDGASLPRVGFDTEDIILKGTHPWSVLIPKTEIILLSPTGGIENAEIGSSFIIK
ncbi:MAG: hypothetical protein RR365_11675 [Bacteroides sp.]